jgi:hypothetical protein
VQSGCLVAIGVIALGALGAVLLLAAQGRGDGRIRLGSQEVLQARGVVYYATDHVFLTVGPDGTVLVLSDLDPHNPPGRDSCRVTFRPDLAGPNEVGRFFDVCTGSQYDSSGRELQGDGLDLRRVPYEVDAEGRLSIADEDTAFQVPTMREQRQRGIRA